MTLQGTNLMNEILKERDEKDLFQIRWPARFPDLMPLDFFIESHVS